MKSQYQKEVSIKLEIYDINMVFIDQFTTYVDINELNNISIDRSNAIRRSFSFAFDNSDGRFSWSDSNLIWINKRIKLYIGLKLLDGTIEYVPQGIFILTNPKDTHNLDNGKKCYIDGQDKAYLFSEDRGMFQYQTTIAKGTNIATAIKTIASAHGEILFNFDTTEIVTPYEITYEATSNKWDAMKELSEFGKCDLFYDIYGYLRLQYVGNLNEIYNRPVVWTYEYGGENGNCYIGNERILNEKLLANHIVVNGGNSEVATVSYELLVDEDGTHSVFAYNLGDDFNRGTMTGVMIDDNELVLLSGTDFNYKNQYSSGTLTNLEIVNNRLKITSGNLSGTLTNLVYDISAVNVVKKSLIKWIASVPKGCSITVETRTSIDGGINWSSWTVAKKSTEITNLTSNTNVTTGLLEIKITLIRSNKKSNIYLSDLNVIVNAQHNTSGTYLSEIMSVVSPSNQQTNNVYVEYDASIAINTTLTLEVKSSLDSGNTWSDWETITESNYSLINISDYIDISNLRFQYQLSYTTTDLNFTSRFKSIIFGVDIENFWQGNKYSIQNIGKKTYFHNDGNCDVLICSKVEAYWRAKYEIMQRLGYIEELPIQVIPNYLLEPNDIIQIIDVESGISDRYRINSFDLPIVPDIMSINCAKEFNLINNWDYM